MSDEQKEFLDKLDALLAEYSISAVKFDTAIRFQSNGAELSFVKYTNTDGFFSVETMTPKYTPIEPEPSGNG